MEKNLIVSAGENETFSCATPIGIGLINSSINLTKILENLKNAKKLPNKIIFIGTAGLYEKGDIFDIFETSHAFNHEISEILDYSYSPISKEVNLKSLFVSRETNTKSNDDYLVNSSNFITTSKKISAMFSKLGYTLENMELYSVLKVAQSYNIPAFGILCATNYCDENAHEDFLKNHSEAKKRLEKYLKEKYNEELF